MNFLNETLKRIKNHITIRTVLADSGFYQYKFICALEESKLSYVISVPLHQVLQKKLYSQALKWIEVADDI